MINRVIFVKSFVYISYYISPFIFMPSYLAVLFLMRSCIRQLPWEPVDDGRRVRYCLSSHLKHWGVTTDKIKTSSLMPSYTHFFHDLLVFWRETLVFYDWRWVRLSNLMHTTCIFCLSRILLPWQPLMLQPCLTSTTPPCIVYPPLYQTKLS